MFLCPLEVNYQYCPALMMMSNTYLDVAEDKSKFLSVIDTGGTRLYVGFELFRTMTPYLNGETFIIQDFAAYFDCAVPQLVEFKYNDVWIPIDPLDMIIPNAQRTINGTLM